MLEPYIRPTLERMFVKPLLNISLISKGLSPNACTLMGAFAGGLVVLPLYYEKTVWAVLLLILSGFLDMFDGALARHQGKSSAEGTVLDIVCDRYVEFSVIFGLLLQSVGDRAIMCFLMLGAVLLCVTSFLVVGIFSENQTQKSFYYSPGLMERAEAFLFFGAMMIFPRYFHLIAGLFVASLILTTVIRLIEFSIQIKATSVGALPK